MSLLCRVGATPGAVGARPSSRRACSDCIKLHIYLVPAASSSLGLIACLAFHLGVSLVFAVLFTEELFWSRFWSCLLRNFATVDVDVVKQRA
jgi:hypothetical protein